MMKSLTTKEIKLLGVAMLTVFTVLAQPVKVKTEQRNLSIEYKGKDRVTGGSAFLGKEFGGEISSRIEEEVVLLSFSNRGARQLQADEFGGIFFQPIKEYKQGVLLWRYKPWNSWTMPMKVNHFEEIPEWDVQFFYWQHEDGTYGAAVPISGNGYRTTLGKNAGKWGSKASTCLVENPDSIPGMAVAFSSDPYELFSRIYRVALNSMGKQENLRQGKDYPIPLEYIGWCSWNSSDNGNNLNEELLLKAAKSFSTANFHLGWILIDDGWLRSDNGRMQSFKPSLEKFPNGFKPVIDKIKHDFKIPYIGVWHTLNGHWNGIEPQSELGLRYSSELFSWNQKERPDIEDAAIKTYHFIKPESDSLRSFYKNWHKYFRDEGIDFVKVDNQLVTERMAVNNYPLFTLSEAMHRALNESVQEYFGGAIINCMDMTAEAYLNFGTTAIARTVEDYFPYEEKETFNLKKGNAAAHLIQAVYNSIYFSQMVYTDFDMFQSHHPNAVYHALARALSGGPIYITDNIGEQNIDVLRPLVYDDGKVIRNNSQLLPVEECLFQIQEKRIFKAFSFAGNIALLGVWNAADADSVSGEIKISDIPTLSGDKFILYDFFNKTQQMVTKQFTTTLTLPRMGCALFYIIPITNGFAPIGLVGKYNAPGTILKQEWHGSKKVIIQLYEGGIFKAYTQSKPRKINVDGRPLRSFTFSSNQLTIDLPLDASAAMHLEITF